MVRALATGRNAISDPVSTVMSSKVICCYEGQSIGKAAKIMAQHGVRRVPVLNSYRRLTGIVSLSDMHGRASTHKPREVTFYKDFANSRGTRRKVPLGTVFVAGTDSDDEAAIAARKIFDGAGWARAWKRTAYGYRVEGRLRLVADAAPVMLAHRQAVPTP